MTSNSVTVWAVVAAAGMSRRFAEAAAGTASRPPSKLLAPVAGESVLARVLDALADSRVAGVAVVVNPQIADIIRSNRPANKQRVYVVNDVPESEMIESIQMGLMAVARHFLAEHLDGGSRRTDRITLSRPDVGYLICPGDHPCISGSAIGRCVSAFACTPESIIIASCAGRRGHPIILPGDLAQLVVSWPPTQRLNSLRTRFPDRVREVETQEPGVLLDVDTPADLDNACRRLQSPEESEMER